MTFAAVPHCVPSPTSPRSGPRLTATTYDPDLKRPPRRPAPVRHGDDREAGRLDVRANTTRALAGTMAGGASPATSGSGSAPMCDLFLVLAQTDEGVTCFALPRVLPDGSRNAGSSCSV